MSIINAIESYALSSSLGENQIRPLAGHIVMANASAPTSPRTSRSKQARIIASQPQNYSTITYSIQDAPDISTHSFLYTFPLSPHPHFLPKCRFASRPTLTCTHACQCQSSSRRRKRERRKGKILRRRVTITRAHEHMFPGAACSYLFDENTLSHSPTCNPTSRQSDCACCSAECTSTLIPSSVQCPISLASLSNVLTSLYRVLDRTALLPLTSR